MFEMGYRYLYNRIDFAALIDLRIKYYIKGKAKMYQFLKLKYQLHTKFSHAIRSLSKNYLGMKTLFKAKFLKFKKVNLIETYHFKVQF